MNAPDEESHEEMHNVRSIREASVPLELGYVTFLAKGFIYNLETHQILFKSFLFVCLFVFL